MDDQGELTRSQRNAIREFLTERYEDVFIERTALKVVKQVRLYVGIPLALFLAGLAWVGWDTYSDIEQDVSDEINQQVRNIVEDQKEEINEQVRDIASQAAQEIVDDEVARVLAENIQPEINEQVEEFRADVSSIGVEARQALERDFTSVFPSLEAIEELGEEGIREIPDAISSIREDRLRLGVQIESQDSQLGLLQDRLGEINSETESQSDLITELSSEVAGTTSTVEELISSIEELGQTMDATRDICDLFRIVPAERFVDVLGNPPTQENPELPFEMQNAIEAIQNSCAEL